MDLQAAAGAVEQEAEPQLTRLGAQRINRSGTFTFRPLDHSDVRDRAPDFDQEQPKVSLAASIDPRRSKFTAKRLGTAAAVLSLSVAAIVGINWLMGGKKQQLTAPSVIPVAELGKSLTAGGLASLQVILGSGEPSEIAGYLIGGEEMIPAIQERLKAEDVFPVISEADEISPLPMSDADLRRGFSSLIYQAAPTDSMKLGSPLLTAQMASGVAQGLLEAGAIIEHRSVPVPRQALAVFAERNGRQLLEWNLFIQTWDRTLRSFSEGELGKGPMRFRVVLSLDKPVFENGEFVNQTVIRVQDPFHQEDIIRVVTYPQDPVVSALTPTERELKDDPMAAMKPQTATVDLVRSETGRVTFEKLVCKEFLGLGGHENSSVATSGQINNR